MFSKRLGAKAILGLNRPTVFNDLDLSKPDQCADFSRINHCLSELLWRGNFLGGRPRATKPIGNNAS
jgi:hypothetical protein